MSRKRVAYFGTNGVPGHCFIGIAGVFSRQEQREIENLDGVLQYCFPAKPQFDFFKHNDYLIFAANVSPDDERGMCLTMVAVEGEEDPREVIHIINERPFLKDKFDRICEKYKIEFPKID